MPRPPQKGIPQAQRITVRACKTCNNGWSDDEAHFRNVLLVAGTTNATVHELWETKTQRSFQEIDGRKRLSDLFNLIVLTEKRDHKIYPANDERVMRVVRKVVRGLCCHHHLRWPVPDNEVWVDVQRYAIPPEFLAYMQTHAVEEEIFQYRFISLDDDPDLSSFWMLRFFERTAFIGMVFRSGDAHTRIVGREASR